MLSNVATALDISHDEGVTTPGIDVPRTARERGRAELTAHILEIARRRLAEDGAAALSLRAIARELGLASSAIYRYFSSRDELLTALIVEAYDALGAVAEETDGAPGRSASDRWEALAHTIRAWAREHPNEYSLIYGSPVPGYAAPSDTIDPAARVALVFLRVVDDGVRSGEIATGPAVARSAAVHADLDALRAGTGIAAPDRVLIRAFQVWFQLFGAISFELFGHLHNVIHDGDAFFEVHLQQASRYLLSD